jgi:hypothetical protein
MGTSSGCIRTQPHNEVGHAQELKAMRNNSGWSYSHLEVAMSQPAKKDKGFTAEECAAMKERAKELKAAANKAESESAVLAKIDEMDEPERGMAKRLHAIITASAPTLSPRLWYGMPAYAKDGDVLCFFQSTQKFNTRYATLGFSDKANLDDGALFPVAFALKELTAAEEERLAALVKQAAS